MRTLSGCAANRAWSRVIDDGLVYPVPGSNQAFKEIDMNESALAARLTPTDPPPTPLVPIKGPGPMLMGATTLAGDTICDHDGNSLGELKEIMLDTRTGRIAYAVLSSGSYLDPAVKLFAVPWRALRLDWRPR